MAKRKTTANAADTVSNMRVQPEHAERRLNMQPASPQEVEVVELDEEAPMASVEAHGSQEPLERAVVENGRTIHAPIPGRRRIVGWIEGKQVYGPVMEAFGPGQMVMLPASEVKRLRSLGFLVDPERKIAEPPSERMEIVRKEPPAQGARVTQS